MGGLILADSATGRRVHARCRLMTCFACLPWLAYGHALAIGLARPNQVILLTRLPDAWKDSGPQIATFAAAVRKQVGRLDWAFHLERNPGRPGNHLHGFVRNGALDSHTIARAAITAGLGEVSGVLPWVIHTESGPRAVKYGLKEVLNVPEGADSIWPEAAEYLRINDGRLVHASRGFWIDADTGQSFPSQRAASIAARVKSAPRGRLIPIARVTRPAHSRTHNSTRPRH